jgi:hypothetical protein
MPQPATHEMIGPEMAGEIVYCYSRLGWSEHRIGAYLERDPRMIVRVLRANGVMIRPAIRGRGRPLTCDVDRILELGRLGVTRSMIAEQTGATLNQVRYHLDKHGVRRGQTEAVA